MGADILSERSNVFDYNPAAGDRSLTLNGSHWLWVVTAVFTLSFLAYIALGLRPRNGERVFHYLFTVGLFVGAIAYFAMASDLGWSVVATHLYRSSAATYQVFFAKYIYWVVAFPTIVIALGLVSGISWASIVYHVFLTWIWIISYLVGAYTASRYKWGFFTFGTIAYLLLAYQTTLVGLKASKRFTLSRDYSVLAGWTNLLWFLYPIGWAVTDGGNVMGATQMAIYFGILDLLLLPGLAFAVFFLSRRWDFGLMNLHFTQYGRVPHREGEFAEKQRPGSNRPSGAASNTPIYAGATGGPVSSAPVGHNQTAPQTV